MEKINGIAFEERGRKEGLPVILIHGFPFNRTLWEPQMKILADFCRLVAYDVRGHGESDPGDGQYTMEFLVDDLIDLLDHLKIGKAVLCGLSMGGYIALRAVQRHPDRILGLVLCDTKSEDDTGEVRIKRSAAVAAVKKNGVEEFAAGFVKTVLSEETLKSRPELAEQVRKMITGNFSLGISGTLLALAARTDTTEALPAIAVPTLILVGEHDKLTPPAVSETMAKAIPASALHIIPGAAHLSNLENPQAFNERLVPFLKGL